MFVVHRPFIAVRPMPAVAVDAARHEPMAERDI